MERSRILLVRNQVIVSSPRGYVMFVGRILRGALKLRYLLLGGAVGGGVTLQKVIF